MGPLSRQALASTADNPSAVASSAGVRATIGLILRMNDLGGSLAVTSADYYSGPPTAPP